MVFLFLPHTSPSLMNFELLPPFKRSIGVRLEPNVFEFAVACGGLFAGSPFLRRIGATLLLLMLVLLLTRLYWLALDVL